MYARHASPATWPCLDIGTAVHVHPLAVITEPFGSVCWPLAWRDILLWVGLRLFWPRAADLVAMRTACFFILAAKKHVDPLEHQITEASEHLSQHHRLFERQSIGVQAWADRLRCHV